MARFGALECQQDLFDRIVVDQPGKLVTVPLTTSKPLTFMVHECWASDENKDWMAGIRQYLLNLLYN